MNEWTSVLTVIFVLAFIYYASLSAWKYKGITAIIIGIILINVFTFWASIAIFILFFSGLIYELFKANKLTVNGAISVALFGALKFSAIVVFAALAVNLLIQLMGAGSGSCSRGSPQWC